jgi:hypothetical protein
MQDVLSFLTCLLLLAGSVLYVYACTYLRRLR